MPATEAGGPAVVRGRLRRTSAPSPRCHAPLQYEDGNAHNGRPLLQAHGDQAVYFNSPSLPLSEAEMDSLYDLPFARRPHWAYEGERVPAFDTIKHSIVTMRGCFSGGCTFCSITEHEGRIIQSRSADSVLREVRALSRMEDFRGTITDIGGPTANMYKMSCKDDTTEHACRRLSCVHPGICENLVTDHGPLVELLKRVRAEKGVEHAFVASGVRYDLAARSPEFIRDLARYHTGGQVSGAPEHSSPEVLEKLKKPPIEHYERFAQAFCQASEQAGKDQYLVPYFITAHPGSTMKDTIELALYLKRRDMRPRQVQDFIPTPMAIATTMYFTGVDPLTMEPVPVVRDLREKRLAEGAALLVGPRAATDGAARRWRKAGRKAISSGQRTALPHPRRALRSRLADGEEGQTGRERGKERETKPFLEKGPAQVSDPRSRLPPLRAPRLFSL